MSNDDLYNETDSNSEDRFLNVFIENFSALLRWVIEKIWLRLAFYLKHKLQVQIC